MITPAEMRQKLDQLHAEFHKIVESGDTANILRCVENAAYFAGYLACSANSRRNDLDFTEEELKEIDFMLAAMIKVQGVLGKALLGRRKETPNGRK